MEYIIGLFVLVLFELLLSKSRKIVNKVISIIGVILLIALGVVACVSGESFIGIVVIGFSLFLSLFFIVHKDVPDMYEYSRNPEKYENIQMDNPEGGNFLGGFALGLLLGLISSLFIRSIKEETFKGLKLGLVVNTIVLIIVYFFFSGLYF